MVTQLWVVYNYRAFESDIGLDLIEFKETVGPWQRYALY